MVLCRFLPKLRSAMLASRTSRAHVPTQLLWSLYAAKACHVRMWNWVTLISSTLETKALLPLCVLMSSRQWIAWHSLLLALPALLLLDLTSTNHVAAVSSEIHWLCALRFCANCTWCFHLRGGKYLSTFFCYILKEMNKLVGITWK